MVKKIARLSAVGQLQKQFLVVSSCFGTDMMYKSAIISVMMTSFSIMINVMALEHMYLACAKCICC